MENVRWFMMGDDDTVFVGENLVRVLQKYDHNQLYYVGRSSESHLKNIYFSYNMAYGGGEIPISYPLAKAIEIKKSTFFTKALEKMQDRCIERYTGFHGSNERLQACMAELGVPLTPEKGFHQSPRRNCCRILPNTKKIGTMVIDVGLCNEDEVVEVR